MDEIVHVTTQKGPLAESKAGHGGRKQMRGINFHKILVQLLVIGHTRNQANTQTEPNIGLDDIGIDCGKHHSGLQTSIVKASSNFVRPVNPVV